jgi:adenylyltransferase/sulfurtransferase
MNPHVKVTVFPEMIVAENVDDLIGDSDIIMDCMDNFPARYILNESAMRKGIPLVYGSIMGMDGMLSFIQSPETPCLQCLFPEAPPNDVFPVFGATSGVIGCLQAFEAIKYLTGIGANIKGRLLVWNGGKMEFRTFKAMKDPDCPTCGDKKQK